MDWFVPLIIEGVRMIAEHNADKGPSKYKRSKEENDYIRRLEKNRKFGTINVGEQIRSQGRTIAGTSADQKADLVGRSIATGTMSSVISAEMFRSMDRDTKKSIIDSSSCIFVVGA